MKFDQNPRLILLLKTQASYYFFDKVLALHHFKFTILFEILHLCFDGSNFLPQINV